MGLKGRDPTRNVFGHSRANRLIEATEMAKFSPILFDGGRGVERGPVLGQLSALFMVDSSCHESEDYQSSTEVRYLVAVVEHVSRALTMSS